MVTTTYTTGQFDQSFMFHMIRDFFLLAMVVAAVELGIRYAALRYDFSVQEPARVDRAAQQLASDVKSIMLNSGGPLAAQTVYPILNRNYDDLGLSIAVVPSAVTVESMKVSFQMDVRGLQTRWPTGAHQEASTTLLAEQFCLNCHVKAKVGDVLGTVTVRSYLDRKEAAWWKEVRLTAGALSLKILVHTIVLFLLLRVRMAPLLTLRSTVSSLAKGVMDLRPRAAVNSADEFGELAQDLNHFLDRIGVVVHDLDKILNEVVTVGTRLGGLNRELEQQVDELRDASLRGLSEGAQRSIENQLMAAREAGSFDALEKTLAQTLAALEQTGQVPNAAVPLLREQLASLRLSFLGVSSAVKNMAPAITVAQAHSAEYQTFTQALREMALLEASMQKVAEAGQQVLKRLSQERQGPQAA
jgi:methyl-accepting chemotaxis protein